MGLWFTMGRAVHYCTPILWPQKQDVHVHTTLLKMKGNPELGTNIAIIHV